MLKHLVLDYNGTLALDGKLREGVKESLQALSHALNIYVLTADTFGKAAEELQGIPCQLAIVETIPQDQAKADMITTLGADETIAIGNGANDRLMLRASQIGICVIQEEGAEVETLQAAQIVTKSIFDAFALIQHSQRLVATLRR